MLAIATLRGASTSTLATTAATISTIAVMCGALEQEGISEE